MSTFVDTLKSMSPAKLAAFVGVGVVFLGFMAFMFTRVSTPVMAPLYSGLSTEDSAQIVTELEKAAVPYEIGAGGSQLLVPADRVLRLRMTMAQEGLPSSGNIVGYEIFDRSDKLGTSNFVQNVNMLRALEGELARTIGSMANIESARVHLVMPKRELFSREKQEPTASVALTMRGGNQLSPGEVAAVQHLVASAVPGLKPTQITLVDNKGRLLAKGGEDGEVGAIASSTEEYRLAFEKRTRETIEGLLAKTVGEGRVRAEVTADIDFDRVVTNSETYDPDGQVARSVQNSEEKETSTEHNRDENVSVANQLPDASADKAGSADQHNRSSTDEVINYEISKVVENHIKETGNVNRLSVAVLVDGIYSKDATGKSVYAPRPQADLDKFATLVKSAIGFDTTRGDSVEVLNLQFSEPPVLDGEAGPFDWLKEDLQGIIQTLVIGMVAILAILLIVRPIINRVIEVSMEAKEEEDEASAEQMALMGPDMAALTDQGGGGADEEMVDIARIQGKVKSATVKKVQDILANHPEEALTALRSWIGDRAA